MTSNINLQYILDSNKLTGSNFLDWLRNLRIVLKEERITYVLDGPFPGFPIVDGSESVWRAYQNHLDDDMMVRCIILSSMSHELKKKNIRLWMPIP